MWQQTKTHTKTPTKRGKPSRFACFTRSFFFLGGWHMDVVFFSQAQRLDAKELMAESPLAWWDLGIPL